MEQLGFPLKWWCDTCRRINIKGAANNHCLSNFNKIFMTFLLWIIVHGRSKTFLIFKFRDKTVTNLYTLTVSLYHAGFNPKLKQNLCIMLLALLLHAQAPPPPYIYIIYIYIYIYICVYMYISVADIPMLAAIIWLRKQKAEYWWYYLAFVFLNQLLEEQKISINRFDLALLFGRAMSI